MMTVLLFHAVTLVAIIVLAGRAISDMSRETNE